MISLVNLSEKDLPGLLEIVNAPYVREALFADDRELTVDNLLGVLSAAANGTYTVSFGIQDDGSLAGCITIADIHPVNNTATITNRVVKRGAHGHVGTEAVRAAISHCYNVLNLNRVECRVYDDNRATHIVCRRLGCHKDGVLRQMVYRQGRYQDVTIYSMLRGDWNDRSTTTA